MRRSENFEGSNVSPQQFISSILERKWLRGVHRSLKGNDCGCEKICRQRCPGRPFNIDNWKTSTVIKLNNFNKNQRRKKMPERKRQVKKEVQKRVEEEKGKTRGRYEDMCRKQRAARAMFSFVSSD